MRGCSPLQSGPDASNRLARCHQPHISQECCSVQGSGLRTDGPTVGRKCLPLYGKVRLFLNSARPFKAAEAAGAAAVSPAERVRTLAQSVHNCAPVPLANLLRSPLLHRHGQRNRATVMLM